MNSFIQSMNRNNSATYNGMPTNATSNNAVLDWFFLCGAARHMSEDDIISVFVAAYDENPTLALRILFYARDIEKGLGERRVFRTILSYMVNRKGFSIESVLQPQNITENLIRVDDLVYVADYAVKEFGSCSEVHQIIDFLFKMLQNKQYGGIVAKWMPRKNSKYSALVKYMRKNGFIDTFSSYRKMIVNMTNVVEQQMTNNEWDGINLEHVPSLAMKKYKKAFSRHGILKPFIDKVVAGEAKINASRLYPNDIVKDIIGIRHSFLEQSQRDLLNEQWKNLTKLDELPKEFRALPIIDVSGSMTMPNNIPMSMSVGLGLFMAEHNPNKAFRDYFITFSSNPTFQKIIGHDIIEKVQNAMNADWAMSTDIEATFRLVLNRAIHNRVPEDEMPTHLIIISDMEFNRCVYNAENNVMEMVRRMYESAGYEMPTVVFWNVNGRIGNVPAQTNDKGALLVSGASQNVINFVLKKGYENLFSLVLEVTDNPRYSHIN